MSEKLSINGVDYVRADEVSLAPSSKQIVVLQRGWVVVGDVSTNPENTDELIISNASVIRRWGTTDGLGELVDGPKEDTVLDKTGTIFAHALTVVFRFNVQPEAWS